MSELYTTRWLLFQLCLLNLPKLHTFMWMAKVVYFFWYHLGQTKKMCVSGYRPSLSLGHWPWCFYCRFWFFTIDSSRRKMFSVSSLFLLQLLSKLRPDQFNFWEHRFFLKFEGSVGGKKRRIKKICNFLRWLWLSIKTFVRENPASIGIFQSLHLKSVLVCWN